MTRAVFVHETGGPEVLKVEPHDPGAPGPGTARVRVAAAGVNFIDIYFRTGLYPRPLPFVAGLEGAGTIEAVGGDRAVVIAADLLQIRGVVVLDEVLIVDQKILPALFTESSVDLHRVLFPGWDLFGPETDRPASALRLRHRNRA